MTTGPTAEREIVLVVDDEPTVRRLARRVLLEDGFEVIEAADGAEALELVDGSGDPLRVVVSDIVMPKLNGLQACQAIKSDPETAHIPIILVTTRGEAASLEAGYSSGCSDYVTKPVNSAELLGKIRNILGPQQ